MDSSRHSEDERAAIARLAGAARRHASTVLSHPGQGNIAAAVAELHAISANPHLLAHATTYPGDYCFAATRTLLLAAGAHEGDMEDIAAVQQQRMASGLRRPAAAALCAPNTVVVALPGEPLSRLL